MTKSVYLLGADDPEMAEIASILDRLGEPYFYAECNGERCDVTNVYRCDPIEVPENKSLVCIECRPSGQEPSVIIDHHHPGDPGYDCGAEKFLQGSSLGQLLLYILEKHPEELELLGYRKTTTIPQKGFFFENDNWEISTGMATYIVPHYIVRIAAADHSPLTAYRGECPGIDPEEFFAYRVHSISLHSSSSKKEIERLFRRYSIYFQFPGQNPLDLSHIVIKDQHYDPKYIILRELALKNMRPTILQISFEDKEKIMLVASSEKEIEKVLKSGKIGRKKVSDIFGVPSRGYAGGYITLGRFKRLLSKRVPIPVLG